MPVRTVYLCIVHALCIALAVAATARDECNTGPWPAASRSHSLLQASANVAKTLEVQSQSLLQSPSNSTEHFHVNDSSATAIALGVYILMRIPMGVYILICLCVLSILAVLACHRSEKSADDAISQLPYSRDRQGKMYAYNNENLLTWRIFLMSVPSMSLSWRVWIVVPCVLGTAGFCAAILSLSLSISLLDISKLEECEKYLKVFIAFMLGLFVKNSFVRWNSSVVSFRGLMTSVKQTMWTARLMGLKAEIVDDLERKLQLACHILDAEMHTDLSSKAVAWQSHWDKRFVLLRGNGLLLEEEEKELRDQQEGALALRHLEVDMGIYSTVVWSWIAQTVFKIREEPGVLVPIYVRLVGLSHSCLAHIDKLKTTVQVQIPFTYAYLLSLLVHLNNVIMAICSGLEIGAALMTIDTTASELNTAPTASSSSALYTAIEVVGLQTVLLLIQPMMYQAFLVISHMLNHPFGDHIFHLPTETFLLLMHDEMTISAGSFWSHQPKHDGDQMAERGKDYDDLDADHDHAVDPGVADCDDDGDH